MPPRPGNAGPRLPLVSKLPAVGNAQEEEEQWEKDEEGFFGDLANSSSGGKSKRQLDRQRRAPEDEAEGSGLRPDRVGMDPATSAALARERIRERVRQNNAKKLELHAANTIGRNGRVQAKVDAKFERKKARKEEAMLAKKHSKKAPRTP